MCFCGDGSQKPYSGNIKMTLGCGECFKDLGPGEGFPGREAVMVHPVVTALAYLPIKEGPPSFKMVYLPASFSSSLCFECIENALPKTRRDALKRVYVAYDAETEFNRIDEGQRGKMIDMGSIENRMWLNSYAALKKVSEGLEKGCLFCGNPLQNGLPFFQGATIERVEASKHLTSWPGQNYSFTTLKEGIYVLGICFEDFRRHFPKDFAALSSLLTHDKNPEAQKKPAQLYLTAEVERRLKESGKTIEQILREFGGPGGIEIITEIPKQPDKL